MPINNIQVSEYECVHCGYKWINRVNGKDGPTPKNCAKCKRLNWNDKWEPLKISALKMLGVGAHSIGYGKNYVQFGVKPKKGFNKVVIKINGNDLYDVELWNFDKKTSISKLVDKYNNVFASELGHLIVRAFADIAKKRPGPLFSGEYNY